MKGVVVCPQVEAVEAGRLMLERGGNAVDAAVATAFAQGVADPQMSSIGGNGTLQIYSATKGEHKVIDFYGRAPLKATPNMWADKVVRRLQSDMWELDGRVNQIGYTSVTCPGTLLGLWEVHHRYGTLPWKDLLQPAIDLADNGFKVPAELADTWARPATTPGALPMKEVLMASPAAAKIYIRDGETIRTGEHFAMKDYAETLRQVAQGGSDVLYNGEMTRQIARDFARNGGLLTEEDFRQYRVRINDPVVGDYRGYTVCGNLPPGSGPQIIETLNILEGWDLRSLGFGTADYCDIMARAQKAGFVDRALYLGDPDFQPVPMDKLLSKDHAAEWRHKIDSGETFDVPTELVGKHGSTTTVSAMDEEGNTIAITHTLATPASGVVVEGLGFMFNNSMQVFHPYPGHPNSIAPGKARTTGMSPTIVLKNGAPFLVTSAPGGTRILTGNLQTIVNVIDHRMSIVEAVSAPRVHCEGNWVDVEARVYYGIGPAMERKGHKLVKSDFSYDPFFSLVHAVCREPGTGRIVGAADPRGRGGWAESRT